MTKSVLSKSVTGKYHFIQCTLMKADCELFRAESIYLLRSLHYFINYSLATVSSITGMGDT